MNTSISMGFIIRQLAQCIIQSRVNVKKEQIMRFQTFINDCLKHHNKFIKSSSIMQQLENLIISPKITEDSLNNFDGPQLNIIIVITLKSINKNIEVIGQVWSIQTYQKYTSETLDVQEKLRDIFQEILMLLNRQPLFSQYQKNSKMRQQYTINYNIFLQNQQNFQLYSEFLNQICVLNLSNRYCHMRTSQTLEINLQCYCLNKLSDLGQYIKYQGCFQIMQTLKKKTENYQSISNRQTIDSVNKQQQIKNSQKLGLIQQKFGDIQDDDEQFQMIQQQKLPRKTSLYEIYDTSLQITVLSNDDKSFTSSHKNIVREFQIQIQLDHYLKNFPNREVTYIEIQEEYEILGYSKDQKFLHQSRNLFEELVRAEHFMQIQQIQYE